MKIFFTSITLQRGKFSKSCHNLTDVICPMIIDAMLTSSKWKLSKLHTGNRGRYINPTGDNSEHGKRLRLYINRERIVAFCSWLNTLIVSTYTGMTFIFRFSTPSYTFLLNCNIIVRRRLSIKQAWKLENKTLLIPFLTHNFVYIFIITYKCFWLFCLSVFNFVVDVCLFVCFHTPFLVIGCYQPHIHLFCKT